LHLHTRILTYARNIMTEESTDKKQQQIISLLQSAVEYTKAQDIESALVKLKELLEIEPEHEIGKGMLAGHYAQLGLTDKAKSLFRELLEAHPKNTLAAFQVGYMYYQENDLENAISYWNIIYDNTSPDNVDPALDYYYATALEATGYHKDAISYYNRCNNKLPIDHALKQPSQEALDRLSQ